MSEHFGGRVIFPTWKRGALDVREFLGVIKKAPPEVLNRLNEIAAEISELEASKAQDEESLRGARDVIERAQQIITNVEERARLRELQLAVVENERKAVLLVVTAYEAHLHTPVPDAQQIPHAPTLEQAYKGTGGRIVTVLSQSNKPLTRHEITERLPGWTVNSVSTSLSQLKAEGLVQKAGNRQWKIR
jgi:CRP-like cAMP-binding protein